MGGDGRREGDRSKIGVGGRTGRKLGNRGDKEQKGQRGDTG